MARAKKSWGFPRWGEYGKDRGATRVRMCDFEACQERADHPAPKAPQSDAKWWFCQEHAAEYNRSWNYFEGMSAEEARAHARQEEAIGANYAQSDTYAWGGAEGSDGLTRTEREALDFLRLEAEASAGEIKQRYRTLVKKYHPDHNKSDKQAEAIFQKVRAAYEALKSRIENQSYQTPL
jgi:DnaJ-domain-containing protein 1